MFVIIVNTIIMSTEHYLMSDYHSEILVTSNLVITVIFTVEMLLKILGMGFKLYAEDRMNLFDAFLVIIGLVDLIFLQN